MHLTTCFNPLEIIVNGEKKIVPCGKCDGCRHVRSLAVSSRLSLEMQYHKYGVFFTLTYADPFLPFMSYDKESRIFYRSSSEEAFSFDDFDSGLCWSFPYMSTDSLDLVNLQTSKYGAVPCLRKADVQKFMKRLRITINRTFHEKIQIYYAICGEYGPTTFRPHYHGLLLFDDSRLASKIAEILRKVWYFGSVVSRFTGDGEKSDYVTRYINSVSCLPSIFRPREICPFLLVSKSYPCGFSAVSKEEVQKLPYSCSPTVSITDFKTKQSAIVPLWPVLENRYFPKFTGFSCISHSLRIRLLELSLRYDSKKDFISNCTEQVENMYINLCGSYDDIKTWSFTSEIQEYLYLCFKDVAFSDVLFHKCCNSALSSIYYAARRIRTLMHEYCINSVSDYVDIIERYMKNRALYYLKLQSEFEDTLMKTDPASFKYIDLFNFDSGIFDTKDVCKFVSEVRSVMNHSKMNKRKNEYLRLHPEYSLNSVIPNFGHM